MEWFSKKKVEENNQDENIIYPFIEKLKKMNLFYFSKCDGIDSYIYFYDNNLTIIKGKPTHFRYGDLEENQVIGILKAKQKDMTEYYIKKFCEAIDLEVKDIFSPYLRGKKKEFNYTYTDERIDFLIGDVVIHSIGKKKINKEIVKGCKYGFCSHCQSQIGKYCLATLDKIKLKGESK